MGSRRQESASWRRGYQVWCHKKKMSSGGLNFSMHWRGEVVGRSISPSPGLLKALHAGVLPTVFLLQLWRELRMVLKEGSERPLAAGKREESQQISLLVRCLFGWRAERQNGWAVWVLCSGKGECDPSGWWRYHSELLFPSHPRANHSVLQVKPLCNVHLDFAPVPYEPLCTSQDSSFPSLTAQVFIWNLLWWRF